MKRTICSIVASAVLLAGFAGCNGSGQPNGTNFSDVESTGAVGPGLNTRQYLFVADRGINYPDVDVANVAADDIVPAPIPAMATLFRVEDSGGTGAGIRVFELTGANNRPAPNARLSPLTTSGNIGGATSVAIHGPTAVMLSSSGAKGRSRPDTNDVNAFPRSQVNWINPVPLTIGNPPANFSVFGHSLDAAGTVGSADFTNLVFHPTLPLVFRTSTGTTALNGVIEVFAYNSVNSAITSNSFVTTAGSPRAITFHPNGLFLYVADFNGNVIRYSINQASGALTNRVSVASGGVNTHGLGFSRDGRFLFVSSQGAGATPGSVDVFAVDAGTGALTGVQHAVAPAGTRPTMLTTHFGNNKLYVAALTALLTYNIDVPTGTLTLADQDGPVAPAGTPDPGQPANVIVDSTGSYVVVANASPLGTVPGNQLFVDDPAINTDNKPTASGSINVFQLDGAGNPVFYDVDTSVVNPMGMAIFQTN
ncbi:MAG: lactonase family protein [Vulcanimicrobiota bacterium]